MKILHNSFRSLAEAHWIRAIQKNALWILGGGASAAVIFISCASTGRILMAPPSIPGAEFVGSEECAMCHEDTVRDFKTADHARLQAKGENAVNVGCESCHGPGSLHVEAGGGAGTIVNMNRNPDTCFQCHLDKKAQFSMPFSHPVDGVKMSCSDCHDPHKGSAMKGGGTQIASMNDTCLECHTAQRGPFVFQHDAVREGCTSCHSPHGSVNQKMLTERNSNLCFKCHSTELTVAVGGSGHGGRHERGTCWSAGCHSSVHGSNVDAHLRH